ncbi:MAG: hypothetical protein HYY18_17835 [Planctomycetes bacterium]|nr:hypothetical protein [Planctomycetota bacterium]
MSESDVIAHMRGWRGPEAASLDELFEREGPQAWGRIQDVARSAPASFDAAVVEWVVSRRAASPRSALSVLLHLAGKDPKRAEALTARFRELAPQHPAEALGAAGYLLYEHGPALHGAAWVALARASYDANPEGAWGVAASAARHAPEALLPADVEFFAERRAGGPQAYFEMLFSLACHDDARREDLVARALRDFDAWPKDAVEGAYDSARDDPNVLRPALVAAVVRHAAAAPEKAWDFFDAAARTVPALFDPATLDALEKLAATGPRKFFGVLHILSEKDPAVLDRFVRAFPAHPADAIDEAYYLAHNRGEHLRLDLVDAVCRHFAASAYHAFDILRAVLEHRPELLRPHHVEAALAAVPHATNRAFGFFRRLLELRPEFTPVATVALFDCLALEPVNRATTRVEELQSILNIAQASHVRTELERALREPPHVGSRRARALMAILFRQRSRSKQYVLMEALRFAATAVTWTDRNRTPLWDFLFFLLDNSFDDAVSTAAAERWLEGAFQLHYLMETGHDHDVFRDNFAIGEAPRAAWPAFAAFLSRDEDLSRFYATVAMLAARFGLLLDLSALGEFDRRAQDAEIELHALERQLEGAEGRRREKIEERQRTLNRNLAAWINPGYARLLADPDAPGASPAARELAARERKDLAKHVRDALRAELARIAVEAVESSRFGLYQKKLRAVLGREVDIRRLEPSILPSFLFFGALGSFPNNRKYLARLIEDRLEGRPHDWLRTEPPVEEWKARVRAKQPTVAFDRWRAEFRREVQYRPQDAAAEKKRRVRDDLAQTRKLLESLGAEGLKDNSPAELGRALADLRERANRPPAEGEDPEKRPPPPDPRVLDEIAMNLDRVRIVEDTPESDFAGKLVLEVETDPFEVLFMGEYGFASCLSLRGSNVWSAVSNAIDIDKAVVWVKEPGGNVVGRRLIALTPAGVISYRTYANRHGLSLDGALDRFIAEYAAHCGTVVASGGHPGALLSDQWYDDGAL